MDLYVYFCFKSDFGYSDLGYGIKIGSSVGFWQGWV